MVGIELLCVRNMKHQIRFGLYCTSFTATVPTYQPQRQDLLYVLAVQGNAATREAAISSKDLCSY